MFLLVAGSTETARALVIDEFLGNHSDFKHLALEDIVETLVDTEEDVLDFQLMFMTMVACECAKEARAEGHRIIITCPDVTLIDQVEDEIKEPITKVYLGKGGETEGFDCEIDSAERSMQDICKLLDEIIEATPA